MSLKVVDPKKVSYQRTYRIQSVLKKDFKEIYSSKIDYLQHKYQQYKICPIYYEDLSKPTKDGTLTGEEWWNRVSKAIPQFEDEIVVCRQCEEDFKNLTELKDSNASIDGYGFLCTSSCLWFDYFWFLFHSDLIHKKQS